MMDTDLISEEDEVADLHAARSSAFNDCMHKLEELKGE